MEDAHHVLAGRVSKLEHELAELGRIRLEWEDYFEKFSTLYARLNKRAQRGEASAATPPPEPPINPAALKLLGRL